MAPHVARTRIPGVVSGIGGFGGLFAPDLTGIREPVLVSRHRRGGHQAPHRLAAWTSTTPWASTAWPCASTTSSAAGQSPCSSWTTSPCGKNVPEKVAAIVSGVAEGCVQAGCALIGGETAEHARLLWPPEDYDLAGFSVGMVDKGEIIDPDRVRSGDVVLGPALLRRPLQRLLPGAEGLSTWSTPNLTVYCDELGETPGRGPADPHPHLCEAGAGRSWSAAAVHGISHITGGGFYENIPRCLPEGLTAQNREGRHPDAAHLPDAPGDRAASPSGTCSTPSTWGWAWR